MAHDPDYAAIARSLAQKTLPAAFIDLDAFDENARAMVQRAQGRPIRVATKSLRCLPLIRRLLAMPGYRGLLTYSALETLELSRAGLDDLVIAYPCLETESITQLAREIKSGKKIVFMVDHPSHLSMLNVIALSESVILPVAIDVDVSSQLPGLHFGVNRSCIRSLNELDTLINRLRESSGLRLVGLMGYEAQIAGVPNQSRPIQWLQNISKPHVLGFRAQCVQRLKAQGFKLEWVNGGGTGSLEFTASDPVVTELAAGSGAYSPALFDHYSGFKHKPAAGFALRVTREPTDQIVTCFSGGFVASGPAGKDRLPEPVYPEGLQYCTHEGPGEVQTPLRARGVKPALGDAVIFRPAKAGEFLERFNQVWMIQAGSMIGEARTYRGEGWNFG